MVLTYKCICLHAFLYIPTSDFITFVFDRATFFRGQIEERLSSRLSSWLVRNDLEILVAVSCTGIYLIEPHEGVSDLSLSIWIYLNILLHSYSSTLRADGLIGPQVWRIYLGVCSALSHRRSGMFSLHFLTVYLHTGDST